MGEGGGIEMQFLEVPQSGRELNSEIASMVKEMSKIGPKIPEIARRLGRHKETVRYWYKKLEDNDFAIQAMPNHEALGLRRVILRVQFGAEYKDYIQTMMLAMNDLCYVVSYAKTLPEDIYIVNASVPSELVNEYISFAEALKEQGVFTSLEYFLFDWIRNVPMKAELYDFETGHWEFDIQTLMRENRRRDPPAVSPRIKFDKIDLLLAKELQLDATRELQEIQKAIKESDGVDINYKTLCWHLSEHVDSNRLLKGYRVNWMGTRWDPVTDRARHRSHSFVAAHLLMKHPTEGERSMTLDVMDRLPIVWAEAAGTDYFAEMAIPSEMLRETLLLLHDVMRAVGAKASFHIMDQRNSFAFTIPHKLFDETSRNWVFNREDLLVKFKALENEVRTV
jgi:DNA-binding Lrp family transcriptional regulator